MKKDTKNGNIFVAVEKFHAKINRKALFHQKIESNFFKFKPRNFGKII